MEDSKITPELIQKAREAKNVEELREIANNVGLNYSEDQINSFADHLGILEKGPLDDDAVGNIAGGRSTVNGKEVECADARVCKAIGLEYDPSWEKSESNGCEIWQVPYDVYEEALNKAIDKK